MTWWNVLTFLVPVLISLVCMGIPFFVAWGRINATQTTLSRQIHNQDERLRATEECNHSIKRMLEKFTSTCPVRHSALNERLQMGAENMGEFRNAVKEIERYVGSMDKTVAVLVERINHEIPNTH